MKYAIKFEVNMDPGELAHACVTSRTCPLERVDAPCPFPDKVCHAVTERDWENLKEERRYHEA